MARECELCGKKHSIGNQVTKRGKAKYLGGVGTKITGITKRTFSPNLRNIRVTVGGTNKQIKVCTRCLRLGLAAKRVYHKPFKLPKAAAH